MYVNSHVERAGARRRGRFRDFFRCLAALLSIAAAVATARADCVTNETSAVDLSTWSVYQYDVFTQPNANWVLMQSNTVAVQRVNADASMLLSPFVLQSDQIQGSWMVNTNEDDDFIGFVFGHQDDRHFYLFDWKRSFQNDSRGRAEPGMSVKVISAPSALTAVDLGSTIPVNTNRVRLLYHNAIPWQHFTNYDFNLEFQPGHFVITVSRGPTVLDRIVVNDPTYASGRFGFYNFSQSEVNYSGFTRRPLPPRPLIFVANRSVVEGNAGSTTFDFEVGLSVTNCEPTLVDYVVAPGSATAGQDYAATPSGTLLFEPGETNKLVSVTVFGDTREEADETLRLILSNPVSGTISGGPAIGTIINDDTNFPPACVVSPLGPFTIDVGQTIHFSVSGQDANPDDQIVLSAIGLPAGAAMTPGLPVAGAASGVSSVFDWTPAGDQFGVFPIVFTMSDDTGGQSQCPVTVTVRPLADLALGMTASPSTLPLGGAITYTLNVANVGPSPATGVNVTAALPASVNNVVFVSSQGSCVLNGGNVNCSLGALAAGGAATISVTASAAAKGVLSCSASVSSATPDPVSDNNSASASVTVTNAPPVVSILQPAEGALFSAPPGVITILADASDSDGVVERVDIYAGATLLGAVSNAPFAIQWTNQIIGPYVLTAVATDDDGATATSAPVNILIRACDPGLDATPLPNQSRCVCDEVEFSTTVTTTEAVTYLWRANDVEIPGETNRSLLLQNLKPSHAGLYSVEVRSACASVTRSATLTLRGAGSQNPVSFTNASPLTIASSGAASVYPSSIAVDCLPAPIAHLSVVIDGLYHSFPDDVDMLLVSPAGQSLKLMSDAGGTGANRLTNVVITFTDTATTPLPDTTRITSGAYRPTDYGATDPFAPPAPAAASATNFVPFMATDANGMWSLYIFDDQGGDSGSLARGWSLSIEWADTPPTLSDPQLLPDGRFQTTLHGLPRMAHVLEASSDLANWTPVATNTPSGPSVLVFDPPPGGAPHRFYRAVRCP